MKNTKFANSMQKQRRLASFFFSSSPFQCPLSDGFLPPRKSLKEKGGETILYPLQRISLAKVGNRVHLQQSGRTARKESLSRSSQGSPSRRRGRRRRKRRRRRMRKDRGRRRGIFAGFHGGRRKGGRTGQKATARFPLQRGFKFVPGDIDSS
jgi:hypothetical protein